MVVEADLFEIDLDAVAQVDRRLAVAGAALGPVDIDLRPVCRAQLALIRPHGAVLRRGGNGGRGGGGLRLLPALRIGEFFRARGGRRAGLLALAQRGQALGNLGRQLDLGIFLQSLMLSATSRGLATCAQGAWNNYWTATRRVLGVPEDDYIVCGVSLGYEDVSAPVNRLVSEREPVASFATWHEG